MRTEKDDPHNDDVRESWDRKKRHDNQDRRRSDPMCVREENAFKHTAESVMRIPQNRVRVCWKHASRDSTDREHNIRALPCHSITDDIRSTKTMSPNYIEIATQAFEFEITHRLPMMYTYGRSLIPEYDCWSCGTKEIPSARWRSYTKILRSVASDTVIRLWLVA